MNPISHVSTPQISTPQSNELTVNVRFALREPLEFKFLDTDNLQAVSLRIMEALKFPSTHVVDLAFGFEGTVYCEQQENLNEKIITRLHEHAKGGLDVLVLLWKNPNFHFDRDPKLSTSYFPASEIPRHNIKPYF